MHWSLDFAWNRGLENAPAPVLGDTLPSEGDGQVGWWRERLQAQGLDLEQVERLLAHYCTATSQSEPVPSAGPARKRTLFKKDCPEGCMALLWLHRPRMRSMGTATSAAVIAALGPLIGARGGS